MKAHSLVITSQASVNGGSWRRRPSDVLKDCAETLQIEVWLFTLYRSNTRALLTTLKSEGASKAKLKMFKRSIETILQTGRVKRRTHSISY